MLDSSALRAGEPPAGSGDAVVFESLCQLSRVVGSALNSEPAKAALAVEHPVAELGDLVLPAQPVACLPPALFHLLRSRRRLELTALTFERSPVVRGPSRQ